MKTVRSLQGDTVDAICWRYYGRTAGTVEAVLEANTGLADLGAILPMGTHINLPDVPATRENHRVVQLWD
jgi:phage tail protein X